MTEEAKEGTTPDTTLYDEIRIPKGSPYIIAVFKAPESALAEVAKGNGVLPAQVLGIAAYMILDAGFNFIQTFLAQLRGDTPAGGLWLPSRH